jgi:O-acetylserine/cysteine efflux transporter
VLPLPHLLLAIAVMAVWGSNFVVIAWALRELPPLLLATLRFAFVLLPLVFVLRRPKVSWANLAAYGVFIGAGQFGLLFLAIRGDITPGLASLVVQTQIFFTIGLSMRLTGERVRPYQWAALAVATSGIGVILAHTDATATPLGIGLVLLAALCWSAGNLVARRAGAVNMLAYVVWASLFSVPPLLVLSLIFEGWPAIVHGVTHASPGAWGAVLWQSVGNTMFGYGVWGWLLSKHPAASVTPMALLVPVFGMGASALLLGEPLQDWKLIAMALVMGGLALNMFWPALTRRRVTP